MELTVYKSQMLGETGASMFRKLKDPFSKKSVVGIMATIHKKQFPRKKSMSKKNFKVQILNKIINGGSEEIIKNRLGDFIEKIKNSGNSEVVKVEFSSTLK